MMVEGMSLRAISRLTGASKNTIVKLLEDAGQACAEHQDRAFRELPCKRIQLDEIWAFVGAKEKNASPEQKAHGFGDIWTWTAICADTKLIPSWLVGSRDAEAANQFVSDLASRLSHRVQVTTDGHKPYLEAIEGAFGAEVDYAMLVKVYGAAPDGEKRYSPAQCIGAHRERVTGKPDPKHVSTSYAERANLTMRMHMRRFTRLTNAFSKKAKNHEYAVALNFMYYNFVRIHSSIRVTPAMAAGVTDHLWEISDIVRVIDEWENSANRSAA